MPGPRVRGSVGDVGRSSAHAADVLPVVRAAERFVAAVEARAVAMLAKLELTMPQLRVLLTLRQRGQANGRQLAAAIGLTPGAVVAICDHLEARGYLRRVVDTHDRRITWFALTEQGVAGLTPPSTLARSQLKARIASLPQSEREGFIALADAFADALRPVPPATDDELASHGPS